MEGICTKGTLMKKFLIYARGQVFEKNIKKVNLQTIVAIVDKNAGEEERFENIPIIHPLHIKNLQYDYIAIFSNQLFEEISSELIRYYFIPFEKIVHWKALVEEKGERAIFLEFVSTYAKGYKTRSILDTNISILYRSFLSKESISKELILLDGIGEAEFSIINNLYDNIYSDYRDVKYGLYDLVLLWQIPSSIEDINIIFSGLFSGKVFLSSQISKLQKNYY